MSSRGVISECAACGEEDWGHGDHLLGIHTVDDNRQVQHDKGVAFAAFYCRLIPSPAGTERLRRRHTRRTAPPAAAHVKHGSTAKRLTSRLRSPWRTAYVGSSSGDSPL